MGLGLFWKIFVQETKPQLYITYLIPLQHRPSFLPINYLHKCPLWCGPVLGDGRPCEFFALHSQILKDNNELAGNQLSFTRNYQNKCCKTKMEIFKFIWRESLKFGRNRINLNVARLILTFPSVTSWYHHQARTGGRSLILDRQNTRAENQW